MNTKKEYPVCDWCGSPNVSADAAAHWDHEKQDWTVTNVFDKGHSCDDCGDECRIEWEEGDYPEALAQQPAQSAPVPCDAIPKHQWEVLSCEPNEYEPTMESGWQRCKVCGTRAHFNRDLLREADAALEAASAATRF